MPPFRKPTLVTLRRHDLSQPWGFRLAGGVNHGQPFIVQKVIPESIGHRSGLQEGDQLVRIGNITLKGLTHEEVQEIILRCISTIDLFIIRNSDPNETQNESPDQSNREYNPYGNTGPKSLTEQVLNRMTEDIYYNNCIDSSNPSSPPAQQFYVKEREMYEYSEHQSPPTTTKRPKSPLQRPPPSGRPFSPLDSPTNISYHMPEEQQWLSQEQPRDPRVFGASPRARSCSPSPSPRPQDQSRDTRVFATSPRAQSPCPSPSAHQQSHSPKNEGQRDTRVFGVKPRGASPGPQSPIMNGDREHRVFGSRPTTATSSSATPSPVQYIAGDKLNQKPLDSSKDKQFFAQNKRAETMKTHGFDRPETGRVFNDQRSLANRSRPRMQKFGGSFDERPHWKTPLPQLKTVRPDVNQLLPSHTKQQQTYIVQTPPTEKNARPPPTGTLRRRIKPVWPPPDADGRYVPRSGFNGGRDSPSRRYDWPPSKSQSFDEDYGDDGITSPNPRLRYTTPPPGAWNPRSGSVTPPGSRSFTPTRRVQNTAWPPLSNATPAGRSGYRPGMQSMPSSRRGSRVEVEGEEIDSSDYYVYTINKRIPQTYRPPPNTQYFEQTYHYDTD